ncbi:putative F-box protein PP2-B12 [Senna tora]|uniref:Putative F-box protein PP2-B12 n=1 Tax=Senna tora TaxID=362788 RepID=A0A834TM82_9FABA|nr:putative F-box protein PP2-B12 [Senna tora]
MGNENVFVGLPDECVAHVISFTTPADACRLTAVCKTLNSIADSDAVWDRFLPSDHLSILSTSPTSIPSSPSKKALYMALSHRPIIIDHGRKSFQLERMSGKKCYMLSARDLTIIWGPNPEYWEWKNLPDSRFEEVAELLAVCWLEIHGMIESHKLSSNTEYGAYLVFKMREGNQSGFSVRGLVVKNAEERRDGWLEIEMGRLFVSAHQLQQLHMTLKEVERLHWKRGLIVQGIELRPSNITI